MTSRKEVSTRECRQKVLDKFSEDHVQSFMYFTEFFCLGLVAVEAESETISAVAFKCMGTTKHDTRQAVLEKARELIAKGSRIPVKLEREQDNSVDSNAVCFKFNVGEGWQSVGYVARELTTYVSAAMTSNSIQRITVKWIKYRYWPRSGIGFYTAIVIAKRGEWPYEVLRKASY